VAIVNCKKCDNNVSSMTTICPYCGFEQSETAEAQLNESRRQKIKEDIYRLKMSSYVALSLLLAAFIWFMSDSYGYQHRVSIGPYILFSAGAVAYLVIRILLFRCGMALRKIR
jgi:hypothetical protein